MWENFLIILVIVAVIYGYCRTTLITYVASRPQIGDFYRRLSFGLSFPIDPVIFVPGVKASILIKNNKIVWLKFSQLLHNTEPFFYKEGDILEARGLLDRIIIIPLIAEFRPLYRFIVRLALAPHGYVFAYDWRDYPDHHVIALGRLVDRVTAETGKKPSLVGHSLGGLIAHTYLKEHPDTINKVVYVSTPFRSGIGYFEDIDNGKVVGLNKTILSKEANFSQVASYTLIPERGECYEGKDMMRAETWRDEKWSVFKNSCHDMARFQIVLDRIGRFNRFLSTPKRLLNPLLVVCSLHMPTICAVDTMGVKHYDKGDGRVTAFAASPIDEMPNMKKVAIDERHSVQLNNKKIVNTIVDFLNSD